MADGRVVLHFLVAIAVLLIQNSEGKVCCSSSSSFPSVCNFLNTCCKRDRMIERCLKGQHTIFKTFFGANQGPLFLVKFEKKDIKDQFYDDHFAIKPMKLILNGVQGKALNTNGKNVLGLATYQESDGVFASSIKGLTASFWLKYVNKTGPSQTFFTYGDDPTKTGGARLQVTQPNTTLDEIAVTVNHKSFRLSVIVPAPWNIWSHFMVSVNLSLENGPSLVMYRNGKAVDDAYYNITSGHKRNYEYQPYIGEEDKTKAPNATMDEIALFGRELNSTEVQKVYQFYTGDIGYTLIMEVKFLNETSKDSIVEKAKTLISGVTNDSAVYTYCGDDQLKCTVTVYVTNEDGNAVKPFIDDLGGIVNQYTTTVVPKTDIVMEGHSNKIDEIEVKWEIHDDQPFSMFQYYNVSYSSRTPPSSVGYISNERYDLTATFNNLNPYTVYDVTIKQYFLGGAYKSLTINVTTEETTPGPPTKVNATGMNSTCIRLEWKNPETPIGGKIRGFLINYIPSKTSSVGSSQVEFNTTEQQSYSKDICGLRSLTEYSFNVTAKTIANGKSADAVKGSTLGPVPTDHPENVVSHNATPSHDDTSTCKVSWDNVNITDNNVTSLSIFYTKVGSNKTHQVQLGVGNTSRILTDLDYYSAYKVKVAASNIHGLGPFSPPVYCYTKGLVPAAPPTNVNAVGKTSTSCLVTWGEVPKEFQNNLILGYNVTYLKQGDPESNMKYVDVQRALASKTEIPDLAKFTNFSLTITAYTDKGMGNKSTFVHKVCQTLEDEPDAAPQNFTATAISSTSFNVAWKLPPSDKRNGIIKGYKLLYCKTGHCSSTSVKNYTGTSTVLDNLAMHTEYTFKVLAYTSVGDGPYTTNITRRTLEEATAGNTLLISLSIGVAAVVIIILLLVIFIIYLVRCTK